MIDTPIRPEPAASLPGVCLAPASAAAALAPAAGRVLEPAPAAGQGLGHPDHPEATPVHGTEPVRPAPAPTGLLLCLKLAAVAVAAAAAALSAGFWLGWPDQLGTGVLPRPVLASWGAPATPPPPVPR